FNSTNDFNVVTYKPAAFIFVSEDGSISAWNPDVDPANAILMAHNPNAIYKGVTIANNGGANLLYVANFHESSVDVFDTNFGKVTLNKGAFVDKKIPDGYGPFNVQNIEGKIYVAFAKQSPDKVDEVAGPGLGFVDVFDTSGKLLRRLKHNINLNAPWAIVLAPSDFGKFSGRLLVGNFGSGRIAAYDTNNGNFKGLLRNRRGKPVVSEGLWGLGFGNGDKAGPVNTLFFAAGINDEENGLFGTITPTSKASQEN
ncbi:MAG TPA: TIGR03118 family protein, partial [Candidatus Brocadiaceae bacterium]